MTSPSALDVLPTEAAFGVDLSTLVPPHTLPVVVVRRVTGDVGPVFEDAYKVRLHVFCGEQRIPVELEKDQYESVCTHIVVYVDVTATSFFAFPRGDAQKTPYVLLETLTPSQQQQLKAAHPSSSGRLVPVGTIRVRTASKTSALGTFAHPVAKLERLCVVRECRQYRLGALLVALLEQVAREELQLPAVVLHGQTAVQEFYKKCGYEVVSDVFEEDGIDHVGMRKIFQTAKA